MIQSSAQLRSLECAVHSRVLRSYENLMSLLICEDAEELRWEFQLWRVAVKLDEASLAWLHPWSYTLTGYVLVPICGPGVGDP